MRASGSHRCAPWFAVAFALMAACPGAWASIPARRVVTLAPNLAELVCAAGACNRLVAVSAYTDFPPAAATIRRVGNAYSIDLEAVLAARPDLVLAWYGGTPPQTIARLRRLGLQVRVPRIEGLAGIGPALRQFGRWLGTEAAANRAAARFSRQLRALRQRYANTRPVRVFYQLGTDPAYTIDRRSSVNAVLTLCGGRNVFSGMKPISGPVGAEAVLERAPQVVLFDRSESRAEINAYWARFPTAPAERFHTIYAVDGDTITRASPRVLLGIRQVCRHLATARSILAGHPRPQMR